MNTVRLLSHAKLNLTLDLTGVKDGYHMLDSLVVTVNLADKIIARKRRDALISVTMHGKGSEYIPPEENQAVRAGEKFVAAFDTLGADITVYKNIPQGAGLGGSSADAAGVINALAKLYNIDDKVKLKALADTLGSDTGYMLGGGLARLTGRGEEVERLPLTPEMNFLLLTPPEGVSTRDCYAAYDELALSPQKPRTERCIEALLGMGVGEASKLFGNDLYEPARTLNPEVELALKELKSFSPSGACMTGSGSAVFALFETQELCAWAKSRYRGKFRAYPLKAVYPARKRGSIFHNPYSAEGD